MELYGESISDVWLQALAELRCSETPEVSPHGKLTKEELGVTLRISQPDLRVPAIPHCRWSLAHAVAELLWYHQGREDLEFISRYAPSYEEYSDDGKILHGAYGPRIFGRRCSCKYNEHRCNAYKDSPSQWEATTKALITDPDTRQAVISIHSPADPGTATKDYPCTLALQFFVRGSKLDLHVTMRSNDLWLGTLYDIFCFTALQEKMVNVLQGHWGEGTILLGEYVHHVGSLHLYQTNWEAADHVLSAVRQDSQPPKAYRAGFLMNDLDLLTRCEQAFFEDPLEAQRSLDLLLATPDVGLYTLCAAALAWKTLQRSPWISDVYRSTALTMMKLKFGEEFERCL